MNEMQQLCLLLQILLIFATVFGKEPEVSSNFEKPEVNTEKVNPAIAFINEPAAENPAIDYKSYLRKTELEDRNKAYAFYRRHQRLERPFIDLYVVDRRAEAYKDKEENILHNTYEHARAKEDYDGPDHKAYDRYSKYVDEDENYIVKELVNYMEFEDELGTHHRFTVRVHYIDDADKGGYYKHYGYITRETPHGRKIIAMSGPYYTKYIYNSEDGQYYPRRVLTGYEKLNDDYDYNQANEFGQNERVSTGDVTYLQYYPSILGEGRNLDGSDRSYRNHRGYRYRNSLYRHY